MLHVCIQHAVVVFYDCDMIDPSDAGICRSSAIYDELVGSHAGITIKENYDQVGVLGSVCVRIRMPGDLETRQQATQIHTLRVPHIMIKTYDCRVGWGVEAVLSKHVFVFYCGPK